ncbi:hypothetical protein GGI20_001637 [Coemansia sp. BCRC 34301]|nr:hypothetical protein GGI20_001637 [Coemansia sp. BCRC 34301]
MPAMANSPAQTSTHNMPANRPPNNLNPHLPGMMEISSAIDNVMSASQSIVNQVQDIASRGIEQVDNMLLMISSRAQSVAHILTGNPFANQLLFPFTNYPGFRSEARDAIQSFQSLIQSDASYAKAQLQIFTSIAVRDVTAATADVRRLLTSLYSFSQEAVDIILTSPLLTALTLVNPGLIVATMLAATDPIQLLTNFPAWKGQASARQWSMASNYKQIYSFVSTALPLVENGILGLLGGISNIGRVAEDDDKDIINMRRAFVDLINLGVADRKYIPQLDAVANPQDAWLSVAYNRLATSTQTLSVAVSAVDVAFPSPTVHQDSGVHVVPASPIPTLNSI